MRADDCELVKAPTSQPDFPVTSRSDHAIASVRGFEHEVLTYGRDAAQIFAAAAADPGCALASAYAGLAHILRSTREGLSLARPHLIRAGAHAIDATPRERMLIDGIALWAVEDGTDAMRVLTVLLQHHPDDLFAAKLLQLLQFGAGDAHGMLCTASAVLPHHAQSAVAHAMQAFALDQCGRPAQAEQSARHALAFAPDPWAHHALAHVMDRQGRYQEGRSWMRGHAEDWARCSSFLYTHNWWHAALFDLAVGDTEAAVALFDTHVWAVRKDYCQDQINAVSLLARLELAGADVGARWGEVAVYVAPRRLDSIDGFLDLHYAYALGRAGETICVAEMLRRSVERAQPGAPRWRQLMPAAIAGLSAFAQGRNERALALLAPVEPSLHLLGGSTVQRDLFRRVLHAARSGMAALAA